MPRGRRGAPLAPASWVDWDGRDSGAPPVPGLVQRLRAAAPGAPAGAAREGEEGALRKATRLPEVPGRVWLLLDPGPDYGEDVGEDAGQAYVFGERGLLLLPGAVGAVAVGLFTPGEASELRRARPSAALVPSPAVDSVPGESGRMAAAAGAEAVLRASRLGEGVRDAQVQAEADDARTLWVDYDAGTGKRYKEFRAAVNESFTQAPRDSPIAGGCHALDLAKHMQRHGGSPLLWFDRWAAAKRLDVHDRTYNEVSALVEAFYFAGCVDQLNFGA